MTGDGGLSKDYVIGFVEAEGTLTNSITECGEKILQFAVTQTDECLIRKVADALPTIGGGVTSYNPPGANQEVWKYSTKRKEDIARLIRFFDGEFESENKCGQLDEWREVFKVWNERGKRIELKEKV